MENVVDGESIRDGDWVLMQWARGEPLGAVEGRIALIENRQNGQTAYFLKRVVQTEDGFELQSDNPNVSAMAASGETVVVALYVDMLRPNEVYTGTERAFLKALRKELEHRTTMDIYEAAVQEKTREWFNRVRKQDSLSDMLESDSELRRLRQNLVAHLEDIYKLPTDVGETIAKRSVQVVAQ